MCSHPDVVLQATVLVWYTICAEGNLGRLLTSNC